MLSMTGCGEKRRAAPKAVDGFIDLSDWNFERDGPVSLEGEWHFWWNTLVPAPAIVGDIAPEAHGLYPVPSRWGHLPNPNQPGTTLGAEGHATFKLKVRLPADLPSKMAITSWYMASASTLFVQSAQGLEALTQTGQLGTSKEEEIPSWMRTTNPLILYGQNETTIVVHMSNYHWNRGGFERGLVLGSYEALTRSMSAKHHVSTGIVGLLLIMALYHILLYVERHDDRASLYLGIFCFLISVRQLITERILDPYLPATKATFASLARIEYLSLPLGFIAISAFIYHFAPTKLFGRVAQVISILCVAACLWILLIPTGQYSNILHLLQLGGVLTILMCILHLAITGFRGNRDSLLSLAAMAIFFAAALIEIYHIENTGNPTNLVPAGFCFLILAQSYILARRFAKAHRTADHLTTHLQEEVDRQTESLRKAHQELEATSAKELASTRNALIQGEKLSQLGQLISSIGHEMATPLMLINMTTDKTKSGLRKLEKDLMPLFTGNPEAEKVGAKFKKLIDLLKDANGQAGIGTTRLQDVSQSLRNQSRNDTKAQPHNIKDILTESLIIVGGRLKTLKVEEELTDTPSVMCFRSRIGQVVTNILANATDALNEKRGATMEGGLPTFEGRIQVRNSKEERNGQAGVLVAISDNGNGVPDAIKEKIFDEFFTTKEAGTGTGLGLSMCAEIVHEHGGTLLIEDCPTLGGALFEMWLPLRPQSTAAD